MLLTVTGTVSIHDVPIPVDHKLISNLLPASLFLPSNETPYMFFTIGSQHGVKPRFWLLPGVDYQEAAFWIPNVRLKRDPRQGPFNYWPQLLVNKWLPEVLGNTLGYHKRLTTWIHDENRTTILDRHTGVVLVTAQFKDATSAYPAKKFPQFPKQNNSTIISYHSGLEYRTKFSSEEEIWITPSKVQLQFGPSLMSGLPAEVYCEPITRKRLGSFKFRQHYNFSPPYQITKVSGKPEKQGPKRKVAILGGGIGSITAAFELTNEPDWQQRYDITLYQMGWRLGGKGASGRNAEYGERIEEHGLHVWAGFYDNSFDAFRKCYAELEQAKLLDGVFDTWRDAFTVQNRISMQQHIDGKWVSNNESWPTNDKEPGSVSGPLSAIDYLHMLIEFLKVYDHGHAKSLNAEHLKHNDEYIQLASTAEDWLLATEHLQEAEPMWISGIERAVESAVEETVLHTASRLFRRSLAVDDDGSRIHAWVERLIEGHQQALNGQLDDDGLKDPQQLSWHIIMDLGMTIARAMLAEGVVVRGLERLDKYDLKKLLEKYGAHPKSLNSTVVRGAYDYVFGFEQGDINRPSLAAGVAVGGALRVFLTYKESILWKMNAGMGDTIFTPYYKLLKNRGVKFRFFHRVTALRTKDGEISAIEMSEQIKLKKGVKNYNPFVRVGKLDCWPDRPNYKQLRKGQLLNEEKQNLESFWNEWQFSDNEKSKTLVVGKDFDCVVLGIAPGAFPHICRDLDGNKKWRKMARKTGTVQTLAMQLWPVLNLEELGWPYGATIATSYEENYSTWADMSHLLPVEAWPYPKPENIAYFCGVLEDAPSIPPATDSNFPKTQYKRVRSSAHRWLNDYIAHLWPNAHKDGRFLDDVLRTKPSSNLDPLDQQFYRANIDPSERYVLSLPGSIKYRLDAGRSGFNNLFLAGDWVNTEINAGCVEAATMGGLNAARALSLVYFGAGEKAKIIWPPFGTDKSASHG